MGNAIAMAACCLSYEGSFVKVIYWKGYTKTLIGKNRLAGEIMFEFPDCMVCDANNFFIGHAIPSLTIDEKLKHGHTYFVLPLDIFSSKTLSVSSISSLVAYNTTKRTPINFKECPFEYIKGSNGRVLIKVSPEFLERILMRREGVDEDGNGTKVGFLCSTPELKKQYKQLVGCKEQTWSPKLETISEHNKIRYSPYRLIGLQWKEKEGM